MVWHYAGPSFFAIEVAFILQNLLVLVKQVMEVKGIKNYFILGIHETCIFVGEVHSFNRAMVEGGSGR